MVYIIISFLSLYRKSFSTLIEGGDSIMQIVDSTIVVALISFAGTVLGSMLGVLKSNDKTLYRIEQLEKKVEAHNQLVERMTIVEQETKANEQRLERLEMEEI